MVTVSLNVFAPVANVMLAEPNQLTHDRIAPLASFVLLKRTSFECMMLLLAVVMQPPTSPPADATLPHHRCDAPSADASAFGESSSRRKSSPFWTTRTS